jgi:histidine triad (HIT) family protein
MEPSIFTKIIKGEVPCHKVYEDELVIAFLDIYPLMPGHILVVPKSQIDQLDELPVDVYNALMLATKKLSQTLRKAFSTTRTVMLVLGYDVPHAHIHLLPSDKSDEFYQAYKNKNITEAIEPNHEELAKIAQKIREAL